MSCCICTVGVRAVVVGYFMYENFLAAVGKKERTKN
jgi:hypothetical protein